MIAADRILDQAIRAYCCQHISENVKKEFGIGAKDLFWKLARSHSMSEFQQHLHEFSTAKPRATFYITGIGFEMFSSMHFAGRRYTHDTSNIVECMNSIYLEEREEPVLEMLNGIWHKEMDRRYARYESALKISVETGSMLTDFGVRKLKNGLSSARQFTVQISSPDSARVMKSTPSTLIYTVNLVSRRCSCRQFFDTDIPCSHAIAVIYRLQQAPIDHMPQYSFIQNYLNAYKNNIPVVSIENLTSTLTGSADQTVPGVAEDRIDLGINEQLPVMERPNHYNLHEAGQENQQDSGDRRNQQGGSSSTIEPPFTRVPRGRQAKKRKRVEANRPLRNLRARITGPEAPPNAEIPSRAPPRCSTCGTIGHYARTCQQSHI